MIIKITDVEREEIIEPPKEILGGLFNASIGKRCYVYSLELIDTNGKRYFYEYDKVKGKWDRHQWLYYPGSRKTAASEDWIYPDRNQKKREDMISKIVNEWSRKGFKVSKNGLLKFISCTYNNEILIMES